VNFAEKWENGEKIPLHEKIKEKVRPPGALKPRLDNAKKRMQVQIRKLNKAAKRFSERDKLLFEKTVKAYSKHEIIRAKVYANELAEIRKSKKQIMGTRLALEQISLRLSTVSEFGDVVNILSPSVNLLQNIGKGLSKTLPEAGKELGKIGDLLNGIIADSTQGAGLEIDFEAPNDDSINILNEAAKVVEQNMKQKLPETPTDIPEVKKKIPT
jgi:division protein CdvB (Snf7/Vps24/ESCRT-III family)